MTTQDNLIALGNKFVADWTAAQATPAPTPVPVPTPAPVLAMTDKITFLKHYDHLTLPVDKDGLAQGNHAAEITLSDLLAGWHDEWFLQDDHSLTYVAPDNANGAFTSTAHYCRTELRGVDTDYSKPVTDTITFSVNELPTGVAVVVQQIHDSNEPWVKVEYMDGELFAKYKPKDGASDVKISLLTGLHLGDVIVSSVSTSGFADGKPLTMNFDFSSSAQLGHKSVTMTRGKKSAYRKAGAYIQSNAGKGLRVVVKHYFI